MTLSLVVAATQNNVIGKDNRLLWRLPNDLSFFKNLTWGMPVIMGRKTFDSLGKPLAGRTNIVITRQGDWQKEGVVAVHSLEEGVREAAALDVRECFVIGGGQIYKAAMPMAGRVYLTRVMTTLEGDTFFPEMREEDWELSSCRSFPADAKHTYPYRFEIWQRNGA